MGDEKSHHERISALEHRVSELEEKLEGRISELEEKIDGPPPTEAELEETLNDAANRYEQKVEEEFPIIGD